MLDTMLSPQPNASILLSPAGQPISDRQHHSKRQVQEARSKLLKAASLCIFFMLVEVVGGYIADSLAIMTDAAHLLSDVAGFLISIFALMLGELSPTDRMSFGYRRAEVLGAVLSVGLIWILTAVLLYEAFLRSRNILQGGRDSYVDGKLMFIIACIGLACNLILLKVLGHNHSHSHGGGHGHSHGHEDTASLLEKQPIVNNKNHGHSHNENHGHSHSHNDDHESNNHGHNHGHGSHKAGDKTYGAIPSSDHSVDSSHSHESHESHENDENINVQAAYAHALGDLLQSVGVCIAGAIIWRYPHDTYPMAQLADPIATVLFSVLVIASTKGVLLSSISILMQSVPEGCDPVIVARGLEQLDGVIATHHLHIWSITQGEHALSVHVKVAKAEEMNPVLKRVQHYLRKQKFHHSTVQVEVVGDDLCKSDDCEGAANCEGYALESEDTGNCHKYTNGSTSGFF